MREQRCTGHWVETSAGREFDCDMDDGRVCEVCEFGPFAKLNSDQLKVSAFRDMVKALWRHVGVVYCVRFVGQELFELDSLLMRLGYQGDQYSRNSQDPGDLEAAMRLELGQLYMMVLSLGTVLECNLSDCLAEALEHQESKCLDKLIEAVHQGETLSSEQIELHEVLRQRLLQR